MTSNQIAWQNMIEAKRSNAAREAETYRSNTAKEQEAYRHNLATEQQAKWYNEASIAETRYKTDTDAAARISSANITAQANRYATDAKIAADWERALLDAETRKYAADRNFEGALVGGGTHIVSSLIPGIIGAVTGAVAGGMAAKDKDSGAGKGGKPPKGGTTANVRETTPQRTEVSAYEKQLGSEGRVIQPDDQGYFFGSNTATVAGAAIGLGLLGSVAMNGGGGGLGVRRKIFDPAFTSK
ncbi:hypothetical protein [Chicken picobirnavirus]|uniref:hypothetical protein n=1 Tax=Chicken picobirnavirus TaxID=1930304 RepID=UPI000EB717CA|nr:hypothetical protein [Chicken picobirnavirus]AXY55125.1 hypothetical protein [Chicken picobirnavirus]